MAQMKDKLKLQREWKHSEIAQDVVAMLGCLPLCRGEDIRPLLEQCEEFTVRRRLFMFLPLIQYVRDQWVEKIGPEELSLFEAEDRTNNPQESFFRRFNKAVEVPHPNVFKCIGKYTRR